MAFQLFARRLEFYLTLCVLAIGVEFVVDTLPHATYGLAQGLDVIIGSFVSAAVSIGVACDIAGKEADWSRIFTAASLRWGVVAIIQFIAFFMTFYFADALTPAPDVHLFDRLTAIPIIVIWAAVQIASVPAAIEPVQSRLLLPLLALGKGLAVSTRVVNLARLMLFALILTVLVLAEYYLGVLMTARHVPLATFWSTIPIEMLTLGPLQACATVLYVDFLRRAGR
jgi:hypothetical protein